MRETDVIAQMIEKAAREIHTVLYNDDLAPLDGDEVQEIATLFNLHLDRFNGNLTDAEYDEHLELIFQ
ncbi:hypothetical protein KAR91_60280 [Candidatus Pacearchaeota archaeon]|nr:hypothetical protein [Candidatus Pacearchaeota archaeon]